MARPSRNLIAALCLSVSAGCSVMPRELNLTPFWFHRMDAAGNVLEWDAAWPLLHYERTPEGGARLALEKTPGALPSTMYRWSLKGVMWPSAHAQRALVGASGSR